MNKPFTTAHAIPHSQLPSSKLRMTPNTGRQNKGVALKKTIFDIYERNQASGIQGHSLMAQETNQIPMSYNTQAFQSFSMHQKRSQSVERNKPQPSMKVSAFNQLYAPA